MGIEDVLKIAAGDEFDRAALEVFRRQSRECAPYRDYLSLAGVEPSAVKSVDDIPFLPIELFKTHRVYCGDEGEPETVFTSSATGGAGPSKHFVASAADYERVYTRGFEIFYGPAAQWSIYALLPSYLEREGSSLVRMAAGLGAKFYLRDHEALMREMRAAAGPKILLGVSYALLDLAEELTARGEKFPTDTIVMETGGMKGKRREMTKAQLHETLRAAFNVAEIHSEYGMAELMSQAYSAGGGVFCSPPWMRVVVRDLVDSFDVRRRGRGAIDIIDLANLHSCAFIATQDVGRVEADGRFTVDGRVAKSDVRGCNLLVDWIL